MKLFFKLIFTIVIAAVLVLLVISYESNSLGGPTAIVTEKERVYEDEIIAEQSLKQEYIQILEGNKLPEDAKSSFSKQLPENVSIDVYKGPKGEGYAIITREADKIISRGVGAYAEENTWVKEIQILATSTRKEI